MASFAAFLEVKRQRYSLLSFDFSLHQETDSLGRPASPVMGGTIDCELSAPGSDKSFLQQWMLSPTMQEDGFIILMSLSPETTIKTISFFNAYCVGMQTSFMPGAGGGGSLVMRIRISSQRVAVGAIIHDNNWPLGSHGAGQNFIQPASYQEPQPKPKPKPGLVSTPPIQGLPPTKPIPPKNPTTPRNPPKQPTIPRRPPPLPLPTALLTILLTLFPAHDAGVSNEWEQKLPEQDEQRYRELEAKRSKEIAQGGELSPREEEEFQKLDKRKYPYGRGGMGKGGGGLTEPDPNGGSLLGKPSVPSAKDRDTENIDSTRRENESARVLRDNGYHVEQLPQSGKSGKKQPDYRVNGRIFDCLSPHSGNVRNIADRISDKVEKGQTDRIILNMDYDRAPSLEAMKQQLRDYPIEGLKEVLVVKDGEVIRIFP